MIERLQLSEAEALACTLPFALIRRTSSLTVGPALADFAVGDDLIEARFFSTDEEIRLYWQEDRLFALRATGGEGEIEERYRLARPEYGHSITMRHTLDFDEDGQVYVKDTRLTDWKGVTR